MQILSVERTYWERAANVMRRMLGRPGFLGVSSAAFTIVVFGRIVSAGFSGDDAYRTHLVAYAALHHLSLADATARAGDQWAREHGGFFPLQMLAFALWAGDPTSGFALFVQLCLIALNVGTFVVLVRRITRSSAFAGLAAACFFLAVELRVTDEAVLGPIVTAPLTVECLLVALLSWISYAASGNGRRLLASLLFFAGAVLADAWTYPTALCFCALAFARIRRRQAALLSCAYVGVPAAALIYGCARGFGIPSAFTGRTAAAYARLCGDHVLAALPTIYRATGTLVRDGVSDFGGDHRFHAISHAGIVGWLIACAVALIVAGALRCSLNERFSASCTQYAVITAAGLWFLPALIADRACVYPMYFGVALALALTLRRLRDFAPERKPELRDAFAVGAGVAALFVMYGNVRFNTYAVFVHRTDDLPRQHVAEAARAGFFARLPANATLAVAGPYPFHVGTDDYRDVRNLFYHYAKRAYRTAAAREIEKSGARPANVWYLRYSAPQQILENPSLVAAHWSRTVGQTIFTDQAWGYRRYVDEDEAGAALDRFARPAHGLQVRSFAAYGRRVMVRAQRRCGSVPVQAVFAPNEARVTWGNGFYDPEPFPRVDGVGGAAFTDLYFLEPDRRFAKSQAHLFIERDACAFDPAHVRMTVYADARATLFVRLGAGSKRYVVSPVGVAVDMLVPNHASRRLEVVLQADGPNESELSTILRYAHADYRDIRMLVAAYPWSR